MKQILWIGLLSSILVACGSSSSSPDNNEQYRVDDCIERIRGLETPDNETLPDRQILHNSCEFDVSVAYRAVTDSGVDSNITSDIKLIQGQSYEDYIFNNKFIACKSPAVATGNINEDNNSEFQCKL